jgi:LytS/YehU family sensor histidine kinase
LVVTFVVPDDALDERVPSFLLQPIVENAVRHGVAPRVETGHIAIGAAREADALLLSVEDDGPGFGADPFAVGGVGLPATRERLALRYGDAGSIRCETRNAGARGGGALVTIRIPLDAQLA